MREPADADDVAVSPFYPSALLAAPVVGYGLAWIGHFVFEHNRPATWGSLQHAWWSLQGDVRMGRHMVMGLMDAEIERVAEPA